MSSTSRKFATVAMAGAFVALTAFSLPARSEEVLQFLGPVGPHKPIIATLGSKRVIAFYLPGNNHCALHAVIGENANAVTDMPATRIRVSLQPGQIVHVDSVENQSLNLQCGRNAESLAVVGDEEAVAFGLTTQQDRESAKASATNF